MADSFQASLFNSDSAEQVDASRKPLAARMRPRTMGEIIGQTHLLREGTLLPKLIQSDRFGSLLFWGPPGCGKTTFASVIAQETNSRFMQINAVLSNVAELKQILLSARSNPSARTVLFIDELHRFNKAQQDLLLPDVEEGNIRLIGATTHNPGFYIIPPLVSRSHLFKLKSLTEEQVALALERALHDDDRGLGKRGVKISPELLLDLAKLCDGDMRRALNALEVVVESMEEGHEVSESDLEAFASERQIRYDADEDEHYNTASAFIKSMRGGDPDAALYWMAKMLAGGEDPRFIARRLVILASEDVGMADPMALPLAIAAKEACEFVGQPECELNLAHAVIYLATAPKSNSATQALGKVKHYFGDNAVQDVPKWLQDSHSKVSKEMGQGEGYLYSHEFPEAISGQDYMLNPQQFYSPGASGREKFVSERLRYWKELKSQIKTQN
ncbi:replication-associated recombination protein A [Opitutia bacterium ISCC 51]|nr:replication-associated recombination protein A [Opitutae bacterium ISCC 51]QXD28993.1 replication-associated recombination protein A [Opitutae bacterium ISCC 52]